MNQTTRRVATAMVEGRRFRRGHDRVTLSTYSTIRYMSYRSNVIATFRPAIKQLIIKDAGWQTSTTKNRINGLLELMEIPFYVYQHNHQWYLMNRETGSASVWRGTKTFTFEEEPVRNDPHTIANGSGVTIDGIYCATLQLRLAA